MDPQSAPFTGLYDEVDLHAVDRTDFDRPKSDIPDFGDQAELVAGLLAAANGRPIGELSILDHGLPGQMQFGDERAISYTLAHGSPMSQLAGHFGPDGHIDLHSCRLGAGDAGESFLRQMVALTGVPVSAGIDLQSTLRGFEGPVRTCAPTPEGIECHIDEPGPMDALFDRIKMALTD